MGSEDVLIRCENVSKKFCRDLKKSLWYGARDITSDLLGQRRGTTGKADELRPGEFWANHDINFEVRRGECLGLIGRNGAGKTTLLKMLNGLIKPDTGRIEMCGSAGAMIALVHGFNPILTGRENVFVNGSILGLSKQQIKNRLEEIVEFAELKEFIDSPVQTYSSGMKVRLGFAVAAVLITPDILLLDEVLAVGDTGFKVKCLNRVRELSKTSAVVFVSHTMPQIASLCTNVCVLASGNIVVNSDDVGHAIQFYDNLFEKPLKSTFHGDGATLMSASLSSDESLQHCPFSFLPQNATVEIKVDFEVTSHHRYKAKYAVIASTGETLLFMPCTDPSGIPLYFDEGFHSIRSLLPVGDLSDGRYRLTFLVQDDRNVTAMRADEIAMFRVQGGGDFMELDTTERNHINERVTKAPQSPA